MRSPIDLPRVPGLDEYRAWDRARTRVLERLMRETGITSGQEVPRCEWEALLAIADDEAGPRPPFPGTASRPTMARPTLCPPSTTR